MPLVCYVEKKFNADHTAIIEHANGIIAEYAEQGFDLTLRQLYYQFVARDLLANNNKSYDKLGSVLSDARRAGLVDWDRLVDRTRFIRDPATWSSPAAIVRGCAQQYTVDLWLGQDTRPEVWIEKDALVGVLETACEEWQCPYFSCRGYTSDSDVWRAAQRLAGYAREGQQPIIFHLGDHDPSGIDMSRDIETRLTLFAGSPVEVKRIALNMPQIEEYGPPPNPAKATDCRFEKYRELYGDESWELDALSPTTISELIADEMRGLIDDAAWEQRVELRDEGRRLLGEVARNWPKLTKNL